MDSLGLVYAKIYGMVCLGLVCEFNCRLYKGLKFNHHFGAGRGGGVELQKHKNRIPMYMYFC